MEEQKIHHWFQKEVLKDQKEISQHKQHLLLKNPKITLNVMSRDYTGLILEIEEFVKIKINKNESSVVLEISGTEFTFNRI